MSDDASPDIAAAKSQLESEREQLLLRIERLQAEADHDSWAQPKPDEADQGSAAVERERLRSLASQTRESLEQVDAAIRRIAEGTYGKCLDCGGKISAGRLEARPEADLCVSCQSKRR